MSRLFRPHTLSGSSGPKLPLLLYGTAWKKDTTETLVYQALNVGFRGIDTAAQPKHYKENLVGSAVRKAVHDGIVKREDIFIQTKFTSIAGQDISDMPYDINAPLEEQVKASVASSLSNFQVSNSRDSYLDCVLLHSPMRTEQETLEAWRTLESYVPNQIRHLGISNIYSLGLLKFLYENSTVKPSIVQNRFTAATKFDVPLRRFCREKGIVYESFWTLTGNPSLVGGRHAKALAQTAGVEPEVALYSLVLGLGCFSVLDGTTNAGRMKGDLSGVERVADWVQEHPQVWEALLSDFKMHIGEA